MGKGEFAALVLHLPFATAASSQVSGAASPLLQPHSYFLTHSSSKQAPDS